MKDVKNELKATVSSGHCGLLYILDVAKAVELESAERERGPNRPVVKPNGLHVPSIVTQFCFVFPVRDKLSWSYTRPTNKIIVPTVMCLFFF